MINTIRPKAGVDLGSTHKAVHSHRTEPRCFDALAVAAVPNSTARVQDDTQQCGKPWWRAFSYELPMCGRTPVGRTLHLPVAGPAGFSAAAEQPPATGLDTSFSSNAASCAITCIWHELLHGQMVESAYTWHAPLSAGERSSAGMHSNPARSRCRAECTDKNSNSGNVRHAGGSRQIWRQ